VPVCETVASGWLLAVGFWELSVGCWVLAAAALCWLSGCLVVWLAGQDREAARERGREGESASEQNERTGVRGADEGGGRQGRRAEPPEGPLWSRADPEQSRPEQAGQRNGAHVVE
jgi:hypothetical protein